MIGGLSLTISVRCLVVVLVYMIRNASVTNHEHFHIKTNFDRHLELPVCLCRALSSLLLTLSPHVSFLMVPPARCLFCLCGEMAGTS